MTRPQAISTGLTSLIILALTAALVGGCSEGADVGLDDGDGGADADADGDVDADGDTDVDGDVDGDGDTDADIDGDVDVDGDTDADADDFPPDLEILDEEPIEEPECDTEAEVTLYLSADDSNSMAGPVIARQAISSDQRVTGPIRVYEFLNYYSFDYEPAEPGRVRVMAQMDFSHQVEVEEGSPAAYYDLQIGVRAPDLADEERRPVNLTLSMDTSGSMSGHSLAMVRASCEAIAGSLREGDLISVVNWSTNQRILLASREVREAGAPEVQELCRGLSAAGSTDLHAGLVTAYELARENFDEARINRVVLMSDGGANAGVTDVELIAAEADDAEGEAIYLLGLGMGSSAEYNDELMNAVTDAGKGAYLFIDSEAEARRMLGERFLQNVEVAARNVRVELTLPPTFAMYEFHGEEYSVNPQEVDPQHLAPNDAMIYHQILSSCDATVPSPDDQVTIRATYQTPMTREQRQETIEVTLGGLLTGERRYLAKGTAIVEYAQALEEVQRLSGAAARSRLDEALTTVQEALERLEGDPDLLEIEELLITYRDRL